ncbi:MAG: tetratricopeptide repeat protein [Myxococcales bacterium]
MSTEVQELEAQLRAMDDADPRTRADALNDLAWALRFSDRERARTLAGQARELSIAEQYARGRGRAARTLAMATDADEALHQIFAYAEEARSSFDEAGDRSGSAAARDFLASLHEFVGDLARAADLAFEALDIARELGDPVRTGYALSSVGGVLAASGDPDGAFERLKEALDLFESIDDVDGVQRICTRLAQLFRRQGELERALSYAQRVLQLADRRNDTADRGFALSELGRLEQERGRSAEAERLYREALDAFAAGHAGEVLGPATELLLGRLLMQRGELDEAQRRLRHAVDAMHRLRLSAADEASARRALAELHERRGDLPAAVEQLREVIELRERAARKEARDRLDQVQVRADMRAARQQAEIHRLKYVELTDMQARLVEAEKMAQLGSLAAGTAHELNTPLGVLRSNLGVFTRAAEILADLQGDLGDVQAARVGKLARAVQACTRTSDAAIARLAAVVRNFERFAQLDLAERRSFDVVEGLQSAIALLRPSTPARVQFETRFEATPRLEGWPGELNQAFMTVLSNAAEAIDGEGVVTTEASRQGDEVVVSIRDTGRGMDEAEREALFDVGFSDGGERTKMRLGLTAARHTVQRHHGRIEVRSSPGEGTSFLFRFPVADAAARRPAD